MAPSWSSPMYFSNRATEIEVFGERVLVNYNTGRYEWNGLTFGMDTDDLLCKAISKWKMERRIVNHQAQQWVVSDLCGGTFPSANPPEVPKTDKRKIKDLIAYYYKR